jgi:hypothetical protein
MVNKDSSIGLTFQACCACGDGALALECFLAQIFRLSPDKCHKIFFVSGLNHGLRTWRPLVHAEGGNYNLGE